ncbi:serine/threonine-protein phosphatase 6 regulatory subunit 3 isoform X2 [Orussus abietinus]|uniref:serine/threonine-protein phosphatase 6 regulatory subunit 3 isoform X2 n=1 Tax=Orussus abietinus TaxID=222816 RepID=UPI00062567D0|nr:serine/threonine-protein phosphatase 6 regulatory subunit 3 isoform X2 [Orussus abietinus]
MFWTNNYVSSPQIEALLNKKDVTLQELMDEEDILQECKSQNKKLVEYLTRPDVMEELVMLTLKEPPNDVNERLRYKYPNVACELLTCDVPTLNEKLAGDEYLLSKLYSFIDTDQPLNPLLASFFSKIMGLLIARKSDQNWYSYQFTCLQVLEFLKSRQRCVDRLLQHLETLAIMDLILKLVTQVEGSEMRQNTLNWLNSQELVQRLVKLLSPSSDSAKHTNAAQLLCDMIKATREHRLSIERTGPDPILTTLESGETVALVLETILTGDKLESSIIGGIQLLLALLGQKANNTLNEGEMYGNGAGEDVIDNEQRIKISIATIPYLERLHQLLLDPPHKPPVKTTAGLLQCPFGNTRLHVAKLLVALLSTENTTIRENLADLSTYQTLLDLFFKYSWNNFLHTQVEQCLALAIKCDREDTNDIIYAHIFIKCRLIDQILDAWDRNEDKQIKGKSIRQGYMGHIINIANNIVSQCEKNNVLDTFLKVNLPTESRNKWETLVTTQLVEVNKAQNAPLGSQTQAYITNSEENPDEYNSFSHDAYIQQGQQMTPQYLKNYGYRDDEFNDSNDTFPTPDGQITNVNFTLNEEDLDENEDEFNKVCQQKQKADLEEGGGGLEWGDDVTFQTVIDKWPSKRVPYESSSSEDEDDPHDVHMEFDSTDPWDSTEPVTNNAILPEVNPWDVVSSQSVEPTGWANFDGFENSSGPPKPENESCKETKQEAPVASSSIVENVKPSSEKEKEAEDEVKVPEVKESLPQSSLTNLNSERNVTVDSVNTSDSNANPSDVEDNRSGTKEGNERCSQDLANVPTKSENPSDIAKEGSENPSTAEPVVASKASD